MEELIKLAGVCVVCVPLAALLRRREPELALTLTAAALTLALVHSLGAAAPALEELRRLMDLAGLKAAPFGVLLRCLGAAVVTRIAAGLCRDGGSTALAEAVEMAGARAGLTIALPLVRSVTELVLGFFP